MQNAIAIDKSTPAGPDQAAVGSVLQLIYGRFVGQAVCLVAKLGIADHIAAGRASTERLAAALGAKPDPLRRLLRAMAAQGLFVETPEDHWKTTASGSLLRGDVQGSLRDLAVFFGTRAHALAWLELEYSALTGDAAFGHVHRRHPWEYGKENPSWNDAFNAAMSSIAGAVHQAIADAYDFSGIGHLVDIGGGHGRLMAQILERFPALQGTVFDQPHVVDGVPSYMAERGLSGRCQAVAGDFFQSVPAGADAYIMTAILHDWDDDHCIKILRNCRAAMPARGRVLIGDFILKPPNQPDFARMVDMEMLVVAAGRERTKEEFQRVLSRAGLSLSRIVPLSAGTSLIEALPV